MREREINIYRDLILGVTQSAYLSLSLSQLAGILKPYRGECLLDPPPSGGPAGVIEFTRWREVVRVNKSLCDAWVHMKY